MNLPFFILIIILQICKNAKNLKKIQFASNVYRYMYMLLIDINQHTWKQPNIKYDSELGESSS